MIVPYNAVQTLFDAKLAELANLPTIIKENEVGFLERDEDSSPLTEKYIRTSLKPITTTDLSIGIGGCDNFGGLFVVEIFTPKDNGIAETNYWAGEIINHFPKTEVLTDGTTIAHIEQYTLAPGIPYDNYHKGSVLLLWSSYVQR